MPKVFLKFRNLEEKKSENMTQKTKCALSVKSIKTIKQDAFKVVSINRATMKPAKAPSTRLPIKLTIPSCR